MNWSRTGPRRKVRELSPAAPTSTQKGVPAITAVPFRSPDQTSSSSKLPLMFLPPPAQTVRDRERERERERDLDRETESDRDRDRQRQRETCGCHACGQLGPAHSIAAN